MRVPFSLSKAFETDFEEKIARFSVEQGLIPDVESLNSQRHVARSIVPHVEKLSALFNRSETEQSAALDPYWKDSSNPVHLQAAYFLYFMPCNLYRIAAITSELARLGYRWQSGESVRGIELGAGPAPGAAAIRIAESLAPMGIPSEGTWALLEQNQAMLKLGAAWAEAQGWSVRPFHRKLSMKEGLLPRAAPTFNLWILSFFLNEFSESPKEIATELVRTWERHMDENGIAILVEPALKLQSRKLLEIRKELLSNKKFSDFQVLLPCLGHQACGALANSEDWCHEDVTWWRPPYFRLIDRLAELDRKTLPFSYLVVIRSKQPRNEILSALTGARTIHRLVSPAHSEGQESEFFLCGQDGKRRARWRTGQELDRGDLLRNAEIRGDAQSSRVSSADTLP